MNYLTATLAAAGLAFLLGGGSSAQSKPLVLVGNPYGMWSTSHPSLVPEPAAYTAQQTRTLEPLPPLPPLTEFYNGQSTSVY